MILINLLPHREERRRLRRRAFYIGLGLAALLGALLAAVWLLAVQQMTQAQQARNAFLVAENTRLDGQIKDIASLQADIEGLKARQGAVEDLQTNRNVPVVLLDELVRTAPEGLQLTQVRQTDAQVTVGGLAQSNERVSEFLRNLQGSRWLQGVELVEIKAVNVATPGAAGARAAETRRLYEFSLRTSLRMPSSAASAASAPLAASAAPRS